VEEGGWLAWVPGPLIPFRDGALRQEVVADLDAGARLILADVTTSGRVAMGERDAYRWLDLRCRVMVDNRPVLVERSSLEPRTKPLSNPARADDFACVGSLYLFGFGMLDLGVGEHQPDLWWQAGGSATVTTVRYLGTTAQALTAAQETVMATAWGMDAGA
jgi:urease accessory protein UreH